MEAFCLNSRIVEDDKEFLIQTTNDIKLGVIKANLFVDGELIDASVLPHADDISQEEILQLVKMAHVEKKSEMEYLLRSYKEILEKGRPEQMFHLGTALFCKRMYEEARNLFRSVVKLKHDYHEAYFFLCQTETALGHAEDAVNAGVKAVDLKPNYADYRNALGEAYLDANSCKRAVIEFEEAIKRNVYYADAYFNLALSFILNAVRKEDFSMSTDLTSRCLDLFKKAVLINPEFQTGNYNEAMAAMSGNDLKRAYYLFKGVREDKKEKQRQEKTAYFNRFLIYTDWLTENDINERINFLEREIDRNPDFVDLYYELGVCYLHRAKFNWQKGIENFQKALNINKDLKKATRGLEMSKEYNVKLADAISDIVGKSTF